MGRPEYVEVRCKSALNRVHGLPHLQWSLNPFAGCRHGCVFCFAREFYARADHGEGLQDFSTRILVKTNFPEVLQDELGRRSWRRAEVAVGTATDPYQPVEGRYRLTRRTLEILAEFRTPVGLLTKSPLIVRDVDVLSELARVAGARVYFSITTVDLDLWPRVEPGTANPYKRLQAMQQLSQAGVQAGVLMAPILPGITDSEASIDAIASAAREHEAAFFDSSALRLMPTVKTHYLDWIGDAFPDLLPRYRRAYPGPTAPAEYRARLQERVLRIRERYGFQRDAVGDRAEVTLRKTATLVPPRGRQLALPSPTPGTP